MKKLSLSLAIAGLAAIFCANQSFAQSQQARFGIKAGATLMTLGSATENGVSINYTNRLGFQGGLFADIPLSNVTSLTPQLLYTQKGGDVKLFMNNVNVTGSTQLNYLDLPVLFNFKSEGGFKFFIGPQLAFLLSQTTKANATGSGVSNSASSTSTDGMRKVIIGGNLGAGYSLTDNVGVNLHYIFDLQHAADGSAFADTGERNSGFALTLSYAF